MVNKKIGLVITILVLIGLVYVTVTGRDAVPANDGNYTMYENEELGIRFKYSANTYTVTENVIDFSHRYHYRIMLMPTGVQTPVGGEGPTAITIDAFQNNLDQKSLHGWLTGTNFSNFKLSPTGMYASTTVGGKEAVRYEWDGLYRAHNVAFTHGDYIFSIAGTYLEPTDTIATDYENLLKSIELFPQESSIGVANFSKTGVFTKNNPGFLKDVIYLMYEEPGAPAQYVMLNFNERSICGSRDQKIPCMAMSVSDYGLTNGRRIHIDGVKEGNEVKVMGLTFDAR